MSSPFNLSLCFTIVLTRISSVFEELISRPAFLDSFHCVLQTAIFPVDLGALMESKTHLFGCVAPMDGTALCCSTILLFKVYLKQEFQKIYKTKINRKITFTTTIEGRTRSINKRKTRRLKEKERTDINQHTKMIIRRIRKYAFISEKSLPAVTKCTFVHPQPI